MKKLIVIALILMIIMGSVIVWAQAKKIKPSADVFIDKQLAIIDAHVKILAKQGRVPADFADGTQVLATYGWHTKCGSSEGAIAPVSLLQHCDGGAFGAYSYSEAAFKQAQRSWWIVGTMKAGSDLLVAVNRNAKFDKSNDSMLLLGCTGCTQADIDKENARPEYRGYIPDVLPIGFKVGYMYQGPENATGRGSRE